MLIRCRLGVGRVSVECCSRERNVSVGCRSFNYNILNCRSFILLPLYSVRLYPVRSGQKNVKNVLIECRLCRSGVGQVLVGYGSGVGRESVVRKKLTTDSVGWVSVVYLANRLPFLEVSTFVL